MICSRVWCFRFHELRSRMFLLAASKSLQRADTLNRKKSFPDLSSCKRNYGVEPKTCADLQVGVRACDDPPKIDQEVASTSLADELIACCRFPQIQQEQAVSSPPLNPLPGGGEPQNR